MIVAAEIIAQAKADKVVVFKKKRRHNYRRKRGHRQQHTILKILSIGEERQEKKSAGKARADAGEAAPVTIAEASAPQAATAPEGVAGAGEGKARKAKPKPAAEAEASKSEPTASEMTDTPKKVSTKKRPSGKQA